MDIALGGDEAGGFSLRRGIDLKYLVDGANFVISMMHFNPENNHYVTLGISSRASQDEIRERWKRLMLLYHPDRQVDNREWSDERAKKVNEAYTVLKNVTGREAFDRKLAMDFSRMKLSRSHAKSASGAGMHHAAVRHTVRQESFSGKGAVLRRYLPAAIVVSYIAVAAIFIALIGLRNKTTSLESELRPAGDAVTYEAVPAAKPTPVQKDGLIVGGGVTMSAHSRVTQSKSARDKTPLRKHAGLPERDLLMRPANKRIVARQKLPGRGEASVVRPRKDEAVRPEVTAFNPVRTVKSVNQAAGATALTRSQVEDFFGRYSKIYRKGKLDEFMGLFSNKAVENGIKNYAMIRNSYRRTFSAKIAAYRLKIARIIIEGNTARVSGTYSVAWRLRSGKMLFNRSGRISWMLAKEGNVLKIIEADYDY